MKKLRLLLFGLLLVIPLLLIAAEPLLTMAGTLLVRDDTLAMADAAVVLCGVDYYARLSEAARLYRKGLAPKVVINGNRKSEIERRLEQQGLQWAAPWYEDYIRALVFMGTPRRDIIIISAEDAYDTVSEALQVGKKLREMKFTSLIITTSKFHSRRAAFIWEQTQGDTYHIQMAPAGETPFATNAWWKDGRQVRWLLYEYGSWLYYYWKKLL